MFRQVSKVVSFIQKGKVLARLSLKKKPNEKFFCFESKGQSPISVVVTRGFCAMQDKFETLAVNWPKPFVAHVELNRPNRLNAFNKKMW